MNQSPATLLYGKIKQKSFMTLSNGSQEYIFRLFWCWRPFYLFFGYLAHQNHQFRYHQVNFLQMQLWGCDEEESICSFTLVISDFAPVFSKARISGVSKLIIICCIPCLSKLQAKLQFIFSVRDLQKS